ncbi:MAG TPA: hypothetical protein VIT91_09935 [Chthoniobacterales bacterium]
MTNSNVTFTGPGAGRFGPGIEFSDDLSGGESDQAGQVRPIGDVDQQRFQAQVEGRKTLFHFGGERQDRPGSFIRKTGPAETIHFFAVEAVLQF